MAEAKHPFHETVAETLIEQLKVGTAPWQRPWEPGQPGGFLPVNPTTDKRYKGINAIHLMSKGRTDNRWMTYKQASAAGAQVRKGEKGTPIQYWKFSEAQDKLDDNAKPVLDAKGTPVKEAVRLERPRVFFATVFNAEQIDGLPPIERKEPTWDALERAEHMLRASGAVIRHGEHNRAFYRPATDRIHLPDTGQFPSADNYYATALHELGHWTGHPSRLGRDLAHPFGSEGYAKEELRAEIASMILGEELGIGHDPGQHAAYVGHWIKALEDDPLEIFRAAAEAEKIKDYVMAFEQQQVQAQDPARQAIPTQEVDMHAGTETATDQAQRHGEAWTLEHVKQGTLARVLATARLAQIDAALDLLDQMPPLNTQNAFWRGHELPFDVDALQAQIQAAIEPLAQFREEAKVAEAWKVRDLAAFDAAAKEAFDLDLPHDWNGHIQVQGNVSEVIDGDERVAAAHAVGREPDVWGVYAQHDSGMYQWLADYQTREQAAYLAERLAVVAANAIDNEHERAAILARVQEDRVRRDPNSTPADVLAARQVRKSAEMTAMLNDTDLQARIGEFETQPQAMAQQASAGTSAQAPRTYLNVPYKHKDEAKALGAKWDRKQQSWYVPPGVETAPFAKWMLSVSQGAADGRTGAQARVYLAVPYGERGAAKAAGAAWDKGAKSWYAGPMADREKLQRWLPENVPTRQAPAMDPREEFADALRSMGGNVSGEHPIMDGKTHRIGVEGDKKGEQAGFYVGHLDGHPAGYIKNNRTGIEMKWKSKGYTLDPQEKARLAAEAAGKLAARAEAQERLQEATAQRVRKQTDSLVSPAELTPYLRDKGIQAHAGALTDKDGLTTYLPATDAAGKQWTMQYIQEDGTKRFAKDSRKEGCFHAVGGIAAVAAAPALVIAEGYATAATLAEALGHATVAAFDAGNLPAVAKALHEKFPDKPVIIAGDDDRHLEATQGVNPGKAKAQEAAKAVGGTAIFPIFAPGENVYPVGLEAITPPSYREHLRATKTLEDAQRDPERIQLTDQQAARLKHAQLSDGQLAALNQMKRHTDFNDLATKSALGRAGVERQLRAEVGRMVREVQEERERVRELAQVQERRPKCAARIR